MYGKILLWAWSNMIIDYKKIFILIILIFLGFADVQAANAYKNELTKVSLSPIGSGDVKVTLYMSKPYTEPLRLLKKNDGEFVLIMPETYTSAPQKPSISDVMGDVTDADIKLYSFASSTTQNGYTKIVIKTNGLTNLYPETVTTGGGTLHKTQSQVNKILSETIKPTTQNTQPQKPENKVTAAQTSKLQVKVPDFKFDTKKDSKTEKKVDNKTDNKEVKKTETQKPEEIKKEDKTQEIASNKQKAEPAAKISETEEFQNIDEIKNLPDITGNNTENTVIEGASIGEKASVMPFMAIFKQKLSAIKSNIKSPSFNTQKISNQSVNVLVMLIALMLVAFSAKFALSVLKNSGQKKDEFKKEENENKREYSDFFKQIIDAENQKENLSKPKILSQKRELSGVDIEPSKSHQEILNADQNLTWQEKFRALHLNRKSLLKDNKEDAFTNNDDFQTENTEDMNIENPIKKLTQDFRAVKKVLEKQYANKDNKKLINQDFTPEKIEKIEVINFEDLQTSVQKPKVQVKTTSPIQAKPPKILTKLKLDKNKGFYLVNYKERVSLIGYVNDKVFKLNSYSSVKVPKLYARLTDKTENADTYIVKIDSSKLLVDVDNEKMKLKLMY